jgi:response regulator RpfG family c-di-GMP phosphodiesterase
VSAAPRILCVDDEAFNLSLLQALLEPRGYAVLPARSGEEALNILGRERVDLVLLDVMMPVMNGFEVCGRIKEDDGTRGIPVVLLTALSGREDRIHGIEAGADDFITKPFDKGEVLARIQMLLKVKSLNERLKGAYENILGLVAVGSDIIRSFDPLNFDFRTSVEAYAHRFIRGAGPDAEKPQAVLVGLAREDQTWSWRIYRISGDEVTKAPTALRLPSELLQGSSSRLLCLNAPNLEKPSGRWLSEAMGSLGFELTNAVCYLSQTLVVLILSYGREVTEYDAAVLKSLVTQSLFLRSLALQVTETENAFLYTVQALARAAEANDENTGNHIQRIGEYCAAVARHLGLPESYSRALAIQAQMHDVGKVHIHPDLLRKKGHLTSEEWAEMHKHTLYGAMILGDHPRLQMARNVALSHHEKWDGSGYPFGLRGSEIPLEGRIVCIADQYDALRSLRSYKPALDHATTIRILLEGDGRTRPIHFDPQVLKAFEALHTQFDDIFAKFS